MTSQAISKHLTVLEQAGLITRGRDAQLRPSHLHVTPLKEAVDWLEDYRRFWEDGSPDSRNGCVQPRQVRTVAEESDRERSPVSR
jgi:DNA-binding MarR family transcriptional regulator